MIGVRDTTQVLPGIPTQQIIEFMMIDVQSLDFLRQLDMLVMTKYPMVSLIIL